MLSEFISSLLSTTAPGARQAGLAHEVAAMAARYRRQRTAWDPHLKATQTAIMEAVQNTDPKGKILILGAGLCLDIPLVRLSATGFETHLMDAVLPFSTRLKLLRIRNIQFKTADITGFLAPFWRGNNGDSIAVPERCPISTHGYSLIVSANILSQLPLSFTNSPPEGDTETRIMAALQKAHMDMLMGANCPALLITDYASVRRNSVTQTVAPVPQTPETSVIPTVVPSLLPGEPDKMWDWHLAPKGEIDDTSETTLKVGCWHLKK